MEIAEGTREQALHPFRDLRAPTGWKRIEGDYVMACLHPLPIAQVIEPGEIRLTDVEAGVAEARRIVRQNGSSVLIWWVDPDHAWLGDHLEGCGLVNDDTPGFESTENAMALAHVPRGEASADVDVGLVKTFDDFAAAERVQAEVFGINTAEDRDIEAEIALRYEQYTTPGNPFHQFNARLDGRVVGTAAGGARRNRGLAAQHISAQAPVLFRQPRI